MTDVPDLERVSVVAPIGNSDHSSLSAVISMAEAVLNLCVSREVFLKHKVNWNTVCGAIWELPWQFLKKVFLKNIRLIGIRFVEQYRIYPGITFGLLRILLRF